VVFGHIVRTRYVVAGCRIETVLYIFSTVYLARTVLKLSASLVVMSVILFPLYVKYLRQFEMDICGAIPMSDERVHTDIKTFVEDIRTSLTMLLMEYLINGFVTYAALAEAKQQSNVVSRGAMRLIRELTVIARNEGGVVDGTLAEADGLESDAWLKFTIDLESLQSQLAVGAVNPVGVDIEAYARSAVKVLPLLLERLHGVTTVLTSARLGLEDACIAAGYTDATIRELVERGTCSRK
jgi:hypothetical protein